MNAVILAAAAVLAQVGGPPPYPSGYSDYDHFLEYGYQQHAYPSQAALDAARLRWDPSGKSIDTGVTSAYSRGY